MRDADEQDDEPDIEAPQLEAVDVRDLPIRFSALKCIDRSPKHYRHAALHRGESSLAQRMGTNTHAATFGTPRLVVCSHRRGTKARKLVEAEAVKRESFRAARQVRDALLNLPDRVAGERRGCARRGGGHRGARDLRRRLLPGRHQRPRHAARVRHHGRADVD